jgi:hypothetical protein
LFKLFDAGAPFILNAVGTSEHPIFEIYRSASRFQQLFVKNNFLVTITAADVSLQSADHLPAELILH